LELFLGGAAHATPEPHSGSGAPLATLQTVQHTSAVLGVVSVVQLRLKTICSLDFPASCFFIHIVFPRRTYFNHFSLVGQVLL
jgi:hypothetical protein